MRTCPCLSSVAACPAWRARIATHLRELADAGADEAILVVHPIDEDAIRTLGHVLATLDG